MVYFVNPPPRTVWRKRKRRRSSTNGSSALPRNGGRWNLLRPRSDGLLARVVWRTRSPRRPVCAALGRAVSSVVGAAVHKARLEWRVSSSVFASTPGKEAEGDRE